MNLLRPLAETDLPFLVCLETRFHELGLVGRDEVDVHRAQMRSGDYRYLIFDENGERQGFIILRGLSADNKSVELRRIAMAEPSRGRGRRAMHAVINMAFHNLGAHRFWLDVNEDNSRARHVYNSLGFVHEGTLRDFIRRDDHFVGLLVLSILDSEHRARCNHEVCRSRSTAALENNLRHVSHASL